MANDIKIPENHQAVMPYLILKHADQFLQFMHQVFGAMESFVVRTDPNTIMHGEMMIGDSTIMFAESNEQYGNNPAGLFIYVDNADECFKKAIAGGAKVITPLSDKPYGRSGGVLDPFGNTWWITSVI